MTAKVITADEFAIRRSVRIAVLSYGRSKIEAWLAHAEAAGILRAGFSGPKAFNIVTAKYAPKQSK